MCKASCVITKPHMCGIALHQSQLCNNIMIVKKKKMQKSKNLTCQEVGFLVCLM